MDTPWGKVVAGCLGLILFFLLWTCLGGVVVSIAWNETMPYIFELPKITWQQGVWLAILSWFLIKSVSAASISK